MSCPRSAEGRGPAIRDVFYLPWGRHGCPRKRRHDDTMDSAASRYVCVSVLLWFFFLVAAPRSDIQPIANFVIGNRDAQEPGVAGVEGAGLGGEAGEGRAAPGPC